MGNRINISGANVDLEAFRAFSKRGCENLSARFADGEVSAVNYQSYGSRKDDYKRDNLAARRTFLQSLAAWGAKQNGDSSGSFDLDRLPKSVRDVLKIDDFGLVDGQVTSMKPLSKKRVKLILDAVDRGDGKVADLGKMDVSKLGREICDWILRIADNGAQIPRIDLFKFFDRVPIDSSKDDNARRLYSEVLAQICQRKGNREPSKIINELDAAIERLGAERRPVKMIDGRKQPYSIRSLNDITETLKTVFNSDRPADLAIRKLTESPEGLAKITDSEVGRKLVLDRMKAILDMKKNDLATRTAMRMALKALAERTDGASVDEFRKFVTDNFEALKSYDIMLVRESLGVRLKKAAPEKFTDDVLKTYKVGFLLGLVTKIDEGLKGTDLTLPEGGSSKDMNSDAETMELMRSVKPSSQKVAVDGLAEIPKKGKLSAPNANKLLCGFLGLVGKLLHRDDGWVNDKLGPAGAVMAILKDNRELIAALKNHAEDVQTMLSRASYVMGALWVFGDYKKDKGNVEQFTAYLNDVFEKLLELDLGNDGALGDKGAQACAAINDAVNALAEDALTRVQRVINKLIVSPLLGEETQNNQQNDQTDLLDIVQARHPKPPNETAEKRLEREKRMLAEYAELVVDPKFGGLGSLLSAVANSYVGNQDARDKRSLLGGFFEALSNSSKQITGLMEEFLPGLALNKPVDSTCLNFVKLASDATSKDKFLKDKFFKELAGNVAGGVLKGAGPVLQKLVQMVGARGVPSYLQKAVKDCRNHLKSIPPSYVDARLNEIVIQSNGKIRKLKRLESLGAASIAEAFKCELTDDKEKSRIVVVKMIRPDVRGRMEREIKVLNAAAGGVSKDMKKMLEARIATLKSELSFKEEAQNIEECFELYGKTDDAHLSSARLVEGCPQSYDAIVMELAPGMTLQAYMDDVKSELNEVLEACDIHKDENGKPLFTLLPREQYDAAQGKLKKFYDGVRERHDNLQKFFKRWVENALFGDGRFHGDLHGGNMMIDDHALMTLIDFGNVGRFGSTARKCVVRLMAAAVQKDADSFFDSILPILSDATRNGITTNLELSNKIKGVIRRAFALGDSSSVVQCLLVAVGEIARLGVEIPSSLYNFATAAMRVYTLLEEMEETLESVVSNSCYIQDGGCMEEDQIKDINDQVKKMRGKDPDITDAKVISKVKDHVKWKSPDAHMRLVSHEDRFWGKESRGNGSKIGNDWLYDVKMRNGELNLELKDVKQSVVHAIWQPQPPQGDSHLQFFNYVELAVGKWGQDEFGLGVKNGLLTFNPTAMDYIRKHSLLDSLDFCGLEPLKANCGRYENSDTVERVFSNFLTALQGSVNKYVRDTFGEGEVSLPFDENLLPAQNKDKVFAESLPVKIIQRTEVILNWLDRFRGEKAGDAELDLAEQSKFEEYGWMAGCIHELLEMPDVKEFNELVTRCENKMLEDFGGLLSKEQISETSDVLKSVVSGKNVFSVAMDLGITKGFGMGLALGIGMDYVKGLLNKPKEIRTGFGKQKLMKEFRTFSYKGRSFRVGVDDQKKLDFDKENKSPDAESVHNAEARRALVESIAADMGLAHGGVFYTSAVWQNIAPILGCENGQTMNGIEKAKPLTPEIVRQVLAVYDLTKMGCPVQVENALKNVLGINEGVGLAKGIGGIDTEGFFAGLEVTHQKLFNEGVRADLVRDRAMMTEIIMLAAEIGSCDLEWAKRGEIEQDDAKKWLAAAAKIIAERGGTNDINADALKCFLTEDYIEAKSLDGHRRVVQLQYIALALRNGLGAAVPEEKGKELETTYARKGGTSSDRRKKVKAAFAKALETCGVIPEDTEPEEVSKKTLSQPPNVQEAILDLEKKLWLLPSSLLDEFEKSIDNHLGEEGKISNEEKSQLRKTLYMKQDAPIRQDESSVPKDPIDAYKDAVGAFGELKSITRLNIPKTGDARTELIVGIGVKEVELSTKGLASAAAKKFGGIVKGVGNWLSSLVSVGDGDEKDGDDDSGSEDED